MWIYIFNKLTSITDFPLIQDINILDKNAYEWPWMFCLGEFYSNWIIFIYLFFLRSNLVVCFDNHLNLFFYTVSGNRGWVHCSVKFIYWMFQELHFLHLTVRGWSWNNMSVVVLDSSFTGIHFHNVGPWCGDISS